MKPVDLPIRAMLNSSQIGEVVYDPFVGSGTTLIACQNVGRIGRAVELAPPYCAVVLERMVTAFPSIDIRREG